MPVNGSSSRPEKPSRRSGFLHIPFGASADPATLYTAALTFRREYNIVSRTCEIVSDPVVRRMPAKAGGTVELHVLFGAASTSGGEGVDPTNFAKIQAMAAFDGFEPSETVTQKAPQNLSSAPSGKQPSRYGSVHSAREVTDDMVVSLLDGSFSNGSFGTLEPLLKLIQSGKVHIRPAVLDRVRRHLAKRTICSEGSGGVNGVMLLGASPELMHGSSLDTFLRQTVRPSGGGGASQGLLGLTLLGAGGVEKNEAAWNATLAEREEALVKREEALVKREEAVGAQELERHQRAAAAMTQLLLEAFQGDQSEAREELQRARTEAMRIKQLRELAEASGADNHRPKRPKGERKVPQTLLFELPASFLESAQFERVMESICATTGPTTDDIIDTVSRLAKEILALRFHAAKLRVAHLYQNSDSRSSRSGADRGWLSLTNGPQAAHMLPLEVSRDLKSIDSLAYECASRLRRPPLARARRSGDDKVIKFQMIGLVAAPAVDVNDNQTPDLLAPLLATLITTLYLAGEINEHLHVMMLLHGECLLQDALYDEEEIDALSQHLGATTSINVKARASAINMALLRPGVDADCYMRNPEMQAIMKLPGWPTAPPQEGSDRSFRPPPATLGVGSMLYLQATLEHVTLIPGMCNWSADASHLLTIISATGNDTGVQLTSDGSANGLAKPIPSWPGWPTYEALWQEYMALPAAISCSSNKLALMIEGMLKTESVSGRLCGHGGGIDSFFDVLLLGCYTHRVLDEIRKVVPAGVKPGSVRILAFNNQIPTDACMVALYGYHLAASSYTGPSSWAEQIVPTVKHALGMFQHVHLKWRDVDEAPSTAQNLEEMVVAAEVPTRSSGEAAADVS